jgi:hypothetical protein
MVMGIATMRFRRERGALRIERCVLCVLFFLGGGGGGEKVLFDYSSRYLDVLRTFGFRLGWVDKLSIQMVRGLCLFDVGWSLSLLGLVFPQVCKASWLCLTN